MRWTLVKRRFCNDSRPRTATVLGPLLVRGAGTGDTFLYLGMLAVIASLPLVFGAGAMAVEATDRSINLDAGMRDRCLRILREAAGGEDFWPAMHASEALTLAGRDDEVRRLIRSRLTEEHDAQHRCGLARELVRAGDRSMAHLLFEILDDDDPYAHGHACESLYKVWEIGSGAALRRAMEDPESPRVALMAAAALARWGNPEALVLIRRELGSPDPELARVAAWILARVGEAQDLPSLRRARSRFNDALTLAYFDNSLAMLGDSEGKKHLLENLKSRDAPIRTYAATFAGEARVFEAASRLLPLLDDDAVDVRVRAAQALLMMSSPAPGDRREEIVRDVFPATDTHPRYSEGSIVARRDGSLLYAVTEFAASASDFATARIVARTSSDAGRTWSETSTLQENVGRQNTMSVSFCRLGPPEAPGSPLAMFYLVKNGYNDLHVWIRTSDDDEKAFGRPVRATMAAGYHVMNNDRVTRLDSGRLVLPISSTADVRTDNHFRSHCLLSDDQGRTWTRSRGTVDYGRRGAMEPEVLELDDGRLLMTLRTQLGHIAASYSGDQGDSWQPAVDWGVRAPESPATVRRIPSTGDLLLVWNDTFEAGADHGGRRNPLTLAVSRDEGKTWNQVRNIEAEKGHSYAYASLMFHEGRVLMSYYVRDDGSGRISNRFRSIPIRRLYTEWAAH